MKEATEFQERTAYTILVATILKTVKKVGRFRDVPTEDIVAEAFDGVKDAAESR